MRGCNFTSEIYKGVGKSHKTHSSIMPSIRRSSCRAKVHEPCLGRTFMHEINERSVEATVDQREPNTTRDHPFRTSLGLFDGRTSTFHSNTTFSTMTFPLHVVFSLLQGIGFSVCTHGVVSLLWSHLDRMERKGGIPMVRKGGIRCDPMPRQLGRVHKRRHGVLFAALAGASEDVCEELPPLEEEQAGFGW